MKIGKNYIIFYTPEASKKTNPSNFGKISVSCNNTYSIHIQKRIITQLKSKIVQSYGFKKRSARIALTLLSKWGKAMHSLLTTQSLWDSRLFFYSITKNINKRDIC